MRYFGLVLSAVDTAEIVIYISKNGLLKSCAIRKIRNISNIALKVSILSVAVF